MLGVNTLVKRQMINLAENVFSKMTTLNRDGFIDFPSGDPSNRGLIVVGSTNIMDILKFFVSPDRIRNVARPRELFSLVKSMIEAGFGDSRFTHPDKRPVKILREIKKDL